LGRFFGKKRRKPFCFGLIESPQPCQKRTVFLIYISQDIDIFNPKQMDPGPFVILSPGGETARPAIRWGKSSRIFANRIYSPRQVERQLKEYIDFIWRSGDQTSDVLKVNRIPPKRMKDVIYEIYSPSIFCVKKGS